MWVLVSGLAAVLARSLGWMGLVLALVPVAAGAYGLYHFGPAPESGDETGIRQLEEIYRDTAVQVRDLMETLRGEGAP